MSICYALHKLFFWLSGSSRTIFPAGLIVIYLFSLDIYNRIERRFFHDNRFYAILFFLNILAGVAIGIILGSLISKGGNETNFNAICGMVVGAISGHHYYYKFTFNDSIKNRREL